MRFHVVAISMLLVACNKTGGSDDTDVDTDASGDTDAFVVPEGAVDLRHDFEPADWADPVVYRSKPLVIEPFSEAEYCMYTTWKGETVGIHKQVTYQNDYGHHFIVAGTSLSEREAPDGSVAECASATSPAMVNFEPLMSGGTFANAVRPGLLELPEGMASRMKEGQRLVFQSHYINTTSKPIVVQDEIQFDVVPEAEVETWAASYAQVDVDFSLAPGVSSVDVTCTFDRDYTLLFLGGHMHEWGKSYSVSHDNAEGGATTLYNVEQWDPALRDAPIYSDFSETQGYAVHAGDTFTSRCTWDNDTNENIEFPKEMCASFGMLYPSTAAVICESGAAL